MRFDPFGAIADTLSGARPVPEERLNIHRWSATFCDGISSAIVQPRRAPAKSCYGATAR
jgi:hypothetical protein